MNTQKRRVTNKLIIDELNNMGIPVTNHMSMLDDEVVKKLDAAKIEAPKQTKNKAQTKELDKVEKATDTKNNKPATSKPSPKPAAKPAAKKVDASTKKLMLKQTSLQQNL